MQRRSLLVATAVVAVAIIGGVALHDRGRKDAAGAPWPVLDQYCAGCHNEDDLAGGVSFEKLDRADVGENAKVWEAAVRKLRTGLMPPKGEQPPRSRRPRLRPRAGSSSELDAAWARKPNPGDKPLARLNRTEYANAIRDLLAYDPGPVAAALPAGRIRRGIRQHRGGARRVADTARRLRASGDADRPPRGRRSHDGPQPRCATRRQTGHAQQRHIEGLPLGTRGGLAVEHNFPLDAEYEIAVQAVLPSAGWDNPTGRARVVRRPAREPRVQRRADRRSTRGDMSELRVARGSRSGSPPRSSTRNRAPASTSSISAKSRSSGGVTGLVIDGPYNATGAGDTPSRRAIFTCRPEPRRRRGALRAAHPRAARDARVPPPGGCRRDASWNRLLEFYRLGREEGGDFEVGIQYALSRLLVDPQFLYRFESDPTDVAAGAVYPIGDLELASRLSFFLWSSIPDDELLGGRGRRQAPRPAGARRSRSRACSPTRARSASSRTSPASGSSLRELADFPSQDPDFDADLRDAFRRETELLFADVLRERRSVLELIDADYTYLNERLAAHYGIDGVRGSYMRRVALPPGSPRRGLLGHGSLLTTTSAPNRTSPVVRGAVDRAEPARRGGAEPAARRRRRSREGSGRRGALGGRHAAREARDASQESDLRGVPCDHGPARSVARELRSRGPLARAGGRPCDRRGGRDDGRHSARRRQAICAPRCCRAPARS